LRIIHQKEPQKCSGGLYARQNEGCNYFRVGINPTPTIKHGFQRILNKQKLMPFIIKRRICHENNNFKNRGFLSSVYFAGGRDHFCRSPINSERTLGSA
jgi:hypothetical protein